MALGNGALVNGALGSPWELAALAWLALLGVPLAVIDVRSRRLPDGLTLPAFAGVVLLLGAAAVADHRYGHFGQAIGGAAALAGFYLALMAIRPGGMFLGDVKLAASVGAALAAVSGPAVLTGTFAAFVLAAACALVLIALGRMTRKGDLPFGPFMLAGALLAVLLS